MATRAKTESVALVKTSLRLPEDLWRAAKVQALDERRDMQDIIADALRAYIRDRRKGGSK